MGPEKPPAQEPKQAQAGSVEFVFFCHVWTGKGAAQALQTHAWQGQKGNLPALEPLQEHPLRRNAARGRRGRTQGKTDSKHRRVGPPVPPLLPLPPPPPSPHREQSSWKLPQSLSLLQPRGVTGLRFPEDTVTHLATLGTPESTRCSTARRRLGGWLPSCPCHLQAYQLATTSSSDLDPFLIGHPVVRPSGNSDPIFGPRRQRTMWCLYIWFGGGVPFGRQVGAP